MVIATLDIRLTAGVAVGQSSATPGCTGIEDSPGLTSVAWAELVVVPAELGNMPIAGEQMLGMEAACLDAALDCRIWTWPAQRNGQVLEMLPSQYSIWQGKQYVGKVGRYL